MLLHIRRNEMTCCVHKNKNKQETKHNKETNNNNKKQANKIKSIKEKVEFVPLAKYPIVGLKKDILFTIQNNDPIQFQ